MERLEEGNVVMCIVKRIAGTVVFVDIEGFGEGSITFSEISPGRIRNIRDFVVPKKRIICKVLRVSGDRIDLSLRRVTSKEQKEVLEEYKQEKSYKSVLESVLGEKAKEILAKITEKQRLLEFIENAKENPKELEKITTKANAEKVLTILNNQKTKTAILKKTLQFSTKEPQGIELIKKLLKENSEIEIKYISAGKYSLKAEDKDLKNADKKIKNFEEFLDKESKKEKFEFKIK